MIQASKTLLGVPDIQKTLLIPLYFLRETDTPRNMAVFSCGAAGKSPRCIDAYTKTYRNNQRATASECAKKTEIVLLLQYMFSVGRFPSNTLPKTNMAPENSSQKETSIPSIHFLVLC